MFGCTGVVAYMWRLKDNQWKLVFSFTVWVLGVELRSLNLVVGTFTC